LKKDFGCLSENSGIFKSSGILSNIHYTSNKHKNRYCEEYDERGLNFSNEEEESIADLAGKREKQNKKKENSYTQDTECQLNR